LNKLAIFLITSICLLGCIPSSVKKDDVDNTTKEVRDELIEIRKTQELDTSDVAKLDPESAQLPIERRITKEIQGGEIGVKFSDASWKDFNISLNLNVVPLRVFFEMMQDLTGINFMVGDEVKGNISLKLNNVSWIESLDLVMSSKNLISEVNEAGNVITINTQTFAATQSESLRKALSSKVSVLQAYSTLEAKVTSIIKLYYTKPDVLAKQLQDIISTLNSAGGEEGGGQAASARASFVVDSRSNSIIVQATQSDMKWIKEAIENLDKPTRQVLIEVFIVEGFDNFEVALGSRLAGFDASSRKFGNSTISGTGGGGATTAGGITTASTVGNIASNPIDNPLGAITAVFGGTTSTLRLELMAMQTEGLTKIVSNPKLFIVDNEEATIVDGEEVPYSTVAQAGATPTTEFKNASLQLTVKPSIVEDGNVYMDVQVNKDSAQDDTNPPRITTKELKTKLLIRDGGIALIGGINIINDSTIDDGVPLLKDIPGIGHFFKSKEDSKERKQLYIFLAPKVL